MNKIEEELKKEEDFHQRQHKNFKYEIDYHMEIRKDWFKFKQTRLIAWVKCEIDRFNIQK